MDIYNTKLGDSWDLIAFKVYGKESYMVDLLRANPDYMNLTVFPSGIKLICPDIKVPKNSNLPPWKKRR